MSLVDDLIEVDKKLFEFSEKPDEYLRKFYETALKENRFWYIRDKQNKPIGYLVYSLITNEDIDEYVKSDRTFKQPSHNSNGTNFCVDSCVIFPMFNDRFNLLYIRKSLRDYFPKTINRVYWSKTLDKGKRQFKVGY